MYEIVILPATEKEIYRLPDDIADEVIAAIERLAVDPRPDGCKQMRNYSSSRFKAKVYHRIRVKQSYRIIYHIENIRCIIAIVKVGHRSGVYKK